MAAPPPYAVAAGGAARYMAPMATGYPLDAVAGRHAVGATCRRAVPVGVGASRSISLPIGLATPLQSPQNRSSCSARWARCR